jgi:hypothetical protein
LLLGERELDIAIKEVADAAVRVAVHHPFEWWAPFERESLFRRFAESFDLVLTGHTHYADPHLRWDTSGRALISGAGCLYESREYFNGYSIIQFDEQQKSVVVLLREYYDAKRGFDKCLRLADDGKATYSLAVAAPALTVPSSVQMLDSFRRIIDTTAQQVLLSAVHSTSAPRTLAEIFVTPTLRKEPENSDAMASPSASRGKTTSINEIIASTANLIIVGRREAGRTTLLLYIAMWFLDQPPEHARLPFYVNMRQLSGKPRHALRRAMHSFAMDATQRIDVDELLRQSRCVLCLDDFDPRSPGQNEAISALLDSIPIRV